MRNSLHNYCCFPLIVIKHVLLEAKIDLRQSNPSVSCRICLTMYRCTLTRKELFLKVLCELIFKATLDPVRNEQFG